MGNKNPLRSLAARDDLITEYTEVKTELVDRAAKRSVLEKSEYSVFVD